MSKPAKPRRSRLPREERMASIMAAAQDEFRARGFADAAMSQIAARAGVVEGSIYRYFTNKHDLLTKVIEAWYEAMLADYARTLAGIEGTRARLRYMVWKHLTTIHENPEMCRLMFDHIRSNPEYDQTAVHRLNRLYTRRTLDIVAEGAAAGELRDDLDMRLVRDLIYGCVEHSTWSYLRGEGNFDPDETADAIIELVLNGLGNPAGGEAGLALRIDRAADRLEAMGRG